MTGIREPAVAGQFYSRSAGELSMTVTTLLGEAPELETPAPKALIVPHAGYIYSGPVAATAYAQLRPYAGVYKRVVLLGPCHHVPLRGRQDPRELTWFDRLMLIVAGLANAQANCWPMLLLGGANDSYQNQSGAFQEAPQVEAARPFSKWAARPDSFARVPEYVEQAVRASIARSASASSGQRVSRGTLAKRSSLLKAVRGSMTVGA